MVKWLSVICLVVGLGVALALTLQGRSGPEASEGNGKPPPQPGDDDDTGAGQVSGSYEPPLPEGIPEYIPTETKFQRRFARIRVMFEASPRKVLQRGYGRYIKKDPEEAVPLLVKAVQQDANPRFRAWSMLLLSNLGRTELADSLFIPRLKEDPFFGVRVNAAGALGKLGRREDLEVLRAAESSDTNNQVRQAAGEAIRTILGEEGS